MSEDRRDLVFSVGATPERSASILETHKTGGADTSPLQLISADRLAYYLRIEQEHAALTARLASDCAGS